MVCVWILCTADIDCPFRGDTYVMLLSAFYCALDVGIILRLRIRKYCVGLKPPGNAGCWIEITSIVKSAVKFVWKEMMEVVLCWKVLYPSHCWLHPCESCNTFYIFITHDSRCSLPGSLTGLFCHHSCWVYISFTVLPQSMRCELAKTCCKRSWTF